MNRAHPAFPGLSFACYWPELWRRGNFWGFPILLCAFDVDHMTALLEIEFAVIGLHVSIRIPIPETELSRQLKREATMVNQGLRTSLPIGEAIERIKAITGARDVVVTDELMRQLGEIEAKTKPREEEGDPTS